MRSPTAFIIVYCDGKNCKTQEQIELTTTARGYDERDVDSTLVELGWSIRGGDFCPECIEEMERS